MVLHEDNPAENGPKRPRRHGRSSKPTVGRRAAVRCKTEENAFGDAPLKEVDGTELITVVDEAEAVGEFGLHISCRSKKNSENFPR
jgi:hypothetical protein